MASTDRYEALRCELDSRQFMQQAREESGLSDYGEQGFVKALEKLLDCVARDANFHAAGLKEFKEEMVRNLVNRLRFQEDIKRHPEILEEDVSDPIVIIGIGRAGTTKTQRMMGTDPSLHNVYMWQLLNPAPFPNAVPEQMDPRIAASLGDTLVENDPEAHAGHHAGHHVAAGSVEEYWNFFSHTFNDWYFNARNPSRSWHDWVMSRREPSDLDNHHYLRSLIQYLQWQQGGRRDRRWLLKSCGHLAFMEELTTVFPKATIVHAHRHPNVSVPSLAKLLQEIWSLRVADVDPKFVGELVLAWEKISIGRYLRDRDRLGLDDRIFDIQYDQIRSDPLPVLREIYRRAGHTLTPEAEQEMLRWEQDNEQGKHGKHIYSLEQFGLSEEKIENAFGEYIRRFVKR